MNNNDYQTLPQDDKSGSHTIIADVEHGAIARRREKKRKLCKYLGWLIIFVSIFAVMNSFCGSVGHMPHHNHGPISDDPDGHNYLSPDFFNEEKSSGPHDSSRRKHVDTGSNSLKGDLDLYDLLAIHASSGSIDIGINPHSVKKSHPSPAKVMIKSNSGSVNLGFPSSDIPDRDYEVFVDTSSGTIGGNILHGRKTWLSTSSAHINVALQLFAGDDYHSTLHTKTSSGTQEINVISPVKKSDKASPISEMQSFHRSSSANIILRYPEKWEGTIEGYTASGKVQLHGVDFDTPEETSRNNKHFHAKKGDGNSVLKFYTASGNVDIFFG